MAPLIAHEKAEARLSSQSNHGLQAGLEHLPILSTDLTGQQQPANDQYIPPQQQYREFDAGWTGNTGSFLNSPPLFLSPPSTLNSPGSEHTVTVALNATRLAQQEDSLQPNSPPQVNPNHQPPQPHQSHPISSGSANASHPQILQQSGRTPSCVYVPIYNSLNELLGVVEYNRLMNANSEASPAGISPNPRFMQPYELTQGFLRGRTLRLPGRLIPGALNEEQRAAAISMILEETPYEVLQNGLAQ